MTGNPTDTSANHQMYAMLGVAHAMSGGNISDAITDMEAQGQREIVASTALPSDLRPSREAFEAAGFTLGQPDAQDPMFLDATLPDGWRREGSDHNMWSYILDQRGRRRVAIFYKAAFYDRRAFATLTSVASYALEALHGEHPLILDEWATRDAVAEALEAYAAGKEKEADDWERTLPGRTPENAAVSRKFIAEYRETAAKARQYAADIPATSEPTP